MEAQILEDQIENLVSAFQRASEALFSEIPNAPNLSYDHNLFQRLADGSKLWRQATGTGYEEILTAPEFGRVETMIERRHKLGHTQGIVDQRYVQRSGDDAYSAGQRLVIRRKHVIELAAIIEKLIGGLRHEVRKTRGTASA